MKTRFLLLPTFIFCLAFLRPALGVGQNLVSIPDANFRAFLEQTYPSCMVGVAGNKQLDTLCAAGVTGMMDCNSKNIASLEGIRFFKNITQLSCSMNMLTSLDVSQNTALTELYCSYNQLTALDVSPNTALTWLGCRNNKLTALVFSQNAALKELECNNNKLTALDVSQNIALTNLNCGSNHLTALDVSQNIALANLNCSSNQLTALDVFKNTAMTNLNCSSNQLTSLDVSQNTALTYLNCYSNQLTSLDVSKNTELTYLNCSDNQLTSLDVTKNTALTTLSCYSIQLTSLDVTKNTALTALACFYNQLTSLDVTKNTALTELYCFANQLTSLDVSQNTALTDLGCSSNQLTSLGVSQNTALTRFDCYSNQLTFLDVSQNTALTFLNCGYNILTQFSGTLPNKLCKLYADGNQITCLPNLPNQPDCSDNGGGGFTSNIGYNLCNSNVSGYCYYDYNGNALLNTYEPVFSSKVIEMTKNGQTEYLMTASIGYYAGNINGGDVVNLKTLPHPAALASYPTNWDTTFTASPGVSASVDFRFIADTTYKDPSIWLGLMDCPRLGVATPYEVRIKNEGFGFSSPTVTVNYSALQTYDHFAGAVTLLSHDVANRILVFQINNLPPQKALNFGVYFTIPLGTPLGQPVTVSASIDSPDDANLLNNAASYTSNTCGSYDPNDKTAFAQNNRVADYAAQGDTLTYRIRFQNTGNAPALKVEIRDSLNINLLDPLTFEFLTATHPVELKMEKQGYLTFTFNNINLPDSASDEQASQGAVWFRIRARTGLMCDLELKNRCGIYFDANPPVITNYAHTSLNPTPNLGLTAAATTIAAGTTTVLTASGATSYLWLPGNLAGANIIVKPAATKTYTVVGTHPGGCTASATVTVNVAPTVAIMAPAAALSLAEGNSGTQSIPLTVSLSGATSFPVVVNLTPLGTATYGNSAGADWFFSGTGVTINSAGASITFTSNGSKSINWLVYGDANLERNETAAVTLTAQTGSVMVGANYIRTLTIVNDDVLAVSTLGFVPVVPSTVTAEGNSGTMLVPIQVTLSGANSFPVTAQIDYAGSSALFGNTFGKDFHFTGLTLSNQLVFTANGTKSFNVVVMGDVIVEPNELVNLNLTSPTAGVTFGATNRTVTITNDDAPRLGDDLTASESSLSLYPNPNNGLFNLSVESKDAAAQVNVYDLNGRLVLSRQTELVEGQNLLEFDLTAEPVGLYLLEIQTGDRRELVKVVVK